MSTRERYFFQGGRLETVRIIHVLSIRLSCSRPTTAIMLELWCLLSLECNDDFLLTNCCTRVCSSRKLWIDYSNGCKYASLCILNRCAQTAVPVICGDWSGRVWDGFSLLVHDQSRANAGRCKIVFINCSCILVLIAWSPNKMLEQTHAEETHCGINDMAMSKFDVWFRQRSHHFRQSIVLVGLWITMIRSISG